jgi:hypothetical protein
LLCYFLNEITNGFFLSIHTSQHSIARVTGDRYYGAQANINVWTPHVENQEFSLAQIWVVSGPQNELNTVEAGWQAC